MGLLLTCLSILLTFFSPSDIVPSLGPYHIQLVIIVFGLATSILTMATRPVRGLASPQYILLVGLWGAIVLSHLSHFKLGWAYDSFYRFGQLVGIFFLVILNVYTVRRVKLIAAALSVSGVIMAVQVILAYHTGYLAKDLLLYSAGDVHLVMMGLGNRVRYYGVLQDPNDFAQYLLVCLALLGVFWTPRRGAINLIKLGPPGAVLLYGASLTFSRGALFGLGAILFVFLYRKGREALALIAAPLSLIVLYFVGFTGDREIALDSSSMGRIVAWGAGISSFVRHPIFGVGHGRFTKDVNDLTAHNSFVLCFTELGMFGYFFWLALILVTMTALISLTKVAIKTPEDVACAGTVRSILAALTAFIATGWFLSRTYNETLYILIAVAANLIQLRRHTIPIEKLRPGRWIPQTIACQLLSIVAVYGSIKLKGLR